MIKPKLVATGFLAAALAACGGTQSASPVPPTVTVTVPATTSTTPVAPTTIPPRTESNPTSTVAPAPTRTAPAPAFTGTTGRTPAGGDLGTAVAKVRALGFTPRSTATYDPNQTLRVLVAARTGSADAHTQQAFFFDGTMYLGTDASATSGQIAVVGHGDTDVTLRYAIYRPSDPACCPTGTPRTVDFTLDGGHLVAADPIPGVAERR